MSTTNAQDQPPRNPTHEQRIRREEVAGVQGIDPDRVQEAYPFFRTFKQQNIPSDGLALPFHHHRFRTLETRY
jgi:hypothetical protein